MFGRFTAGLAAAGGLVVGALAPAAVAAPGGGGGPVPSASGGPVVRTVDGAVRGKSTGGVREFLGIPYAAPPVGALRWRPPAPAAHWPGVRQATAFGPHCVQNKTPLGTASTSEDCLYLNVYTPARLRAGMPVMVWIHGGAFDYGESDTYDPSALVRKGVVVVTVNYRLGALGFLADPALADAPGGPTGNYGLMDQQAALRWVRSDIGRFGGDPGKVTIFGQSACGLSVLSHLVSPGSRGLFQRAIVQSGTYNLSLDKRADAEAAGRAFAASVGCADQSAACLRAVPVATVLAKQNNRGYVPDVDGQVITEAPRTSLDAGRFAHVPVVIGTTHDEWRLQLGIALLAGSPQVTAANYVPWIAGALHVPAQTAAVIAARYPLSAYPSPDVALATAVTDDGYSCSTLSAADTLSRHVPVHVYEFNDENAPERFLPPLGFPYGAAHMSELQYLFDLTAPIPGALSPAQQHLGAAMRSDWTDFARWGTPSRWPAFNQTTQRVLSLDPPRPRTETTFATDHQCAFWSSSAH